LDLESSGPWIGAVGDVSTVDWVAAPCFSAEGGETVAGPLIGKATAKISAGVQRLVSAIRTGRILNPDNRSLVGRLRWSTGSCGVDLIWAIHVGSDG
jgi:hypothetical protein